MPSGDLLGGAQVQYRYLIEGLRGSRYEPVVALPSDGPLRETLARAGVHAAVSTYPTWNRGEILRWGHRLWPERRRAAERLVALARTHAPSVVHGDASVAPYLAAIAQALRIPCVVHVRGRVRQSWVHRFAGHASRVIAIGEPYGDWLAQSGVSRSRINVVPDATDLDCFRPSRTSVLREQYAPIDGDDVLIGIAGRIEPFKQQVQFLRAAARVIGAGRRAHFVVIGGRNTNRPLYYHRVRSWPARHGIASRVTFTGARDDMEHVMPSLDVLVTLSGGSVMLEAMACAVPVISASPRDPATLRMVRDGEGGRVVPAHDLEALVRAMIQLCDDALARKRLGASGRRRVEALFGRDHMVQATKRVYDAVVRDPSRVRGPGSEVLRDP